MEITASPRFVRSAKKLVAEDKSVRKKLDVILKLLSDDLDRPSLRRHKLSGGDTWSVSLNLSLRITYNQHGDEIYLLDIGSHDDVY